MRNTIVSAFAAVAIVSALASGCRTAAPEAVHAAATPPLAGAPRPARPNILFIMSDDHAAHALSCYGSVINQTPHLDRLAREGMRFDRCFVVNSICTPSRATILTGKYSHLNGTPVFNRFDGSQPTVAKQLQAEGYYTGMLGKWHLGSDPTGFDQWIILPGQGRYQDPFFLDRHGRFMLTGYVTDMLGDMAIQFLENRPKDRPFFLMWHHKAPHREWTPDAKHEKMFVGVDLPEPPTLRDDYGTRTDAAREATMTVANDLTRFDLKLVPPEELHGTNRQNWLNTKPTEVVVEINGQPQTLTGEPLRRWKYQRYIKDYLRCIASVDDNVGRVLDYLDRTGLATNTVVIYTSDNGFFLGDHGWYDKRFMYEESLRIPFLVRWPGVIAPGVVETNLVLNLDFAPTFRDLAGLPASSEMQGRSLVPLFQDQHPVVWRTSFYYRYYHDPGDHNTRAHYGVRTETQKLIYYWKKNQWECFDLTADPHELNNLSGDPARAATVVALKRELHRLKREVRDDDQFAEQQPPAGVDSQPEGATRPARNWAATPQP